jgi:hypothetical protein
MHCKQARQQIDRLPQPLQASLEVTQHTIQCQACAKFFQGRAALHNALANLRAETATLCPSAHVEQQVLAALDAPGLQPLRTHQPLRWITVSALALAALLLARVVFPVGPTQPVSPIAEVPHEQPFTALPYVVPAAPDERTTVVRTRVSLQIMQNAGLHVQDDPGSTALADVVLSQDGRLLALRLVSHPDPPSEKRIN